MVVELDRIRKAVLPVAGFGTRFLPATKAMPKELLPIINKPLIQYAAEEAVAAGIDTLIFITGRNKRSIEDHFDYNHDLDAHLRSKNLGSTADEIKNILPKHVDFLFVRQQEQLGLGHAILCAEKAVGNEPFAVLLADDFIPPLEKGVTTLLCEAFLKTQKTQLYAEYIDGIQITKYGVIQPGKEKGHVAGLVEKPSQKVAPSNWASLGRYVLTPNIFDILRQQPNGCNGEIQLADAIHTLALLNEVRSLTSNHKTFDCGSVEGYIDAIRHMANRMGY